MESKSRILSPKAFNQVKNLCLPSGLHCLNGTKCDPDVDDRDVGVRPDSLLKR